MFYEPDLGRVYKCPACGGRVYLAKEKDGKSVYVHQTANNYADHRKHCPRRKPDVALNDTDNN